MLIGIAGAIGSGKSFTQLKQALIYCEKKRKTLVTNFEINERALFDYAVLAKLEYVQSMVAKGQVSWIINPKRRIKGEFRPNLEALFIPNSVIALDEAGIFLNSRDFARTSTDLLSDLCQSRKMGVDLFWAAQFEEQVDKQFRLLTQYWVHCDSVSVYDKKLRNSRLKWKRIFWFTAADYFFWLSNPRDRSSHFKTRFAYACDYEGGLLTAADRKLFEIFDSFSRLDYAATSDRVRSSLVCPLIQSRVVTDPSQPIPPSWALLPRTQTLNPIPVGGGVGGALAPS
jgi:hypothetical protein